MSPVHTKHIVTYASSHCILFATPEPLPHDKAEHFLLTFICQNSVPSMFSTTWPAYTNFLFVFLLKKSFFFFFGSLYEPKYSSLLLISPMHNLQSYKDQVHSLFLMSKCSKIAFMSDPLENFFSTLNGIFFSISFDRLCNR